MACRELRFVVVGQGWFSIFATRFDPGFVWDGLEMDDPASGTELSI